MILLMGLVLIACGLNLLVTLAARAEAARARAAAEHAQRDALESNRWSKYIADQQLSIANAAIVSRANIAASIEGVAVDVQTLTATVASTPIPGERTH